MYRDKKTMKATFMKHKMLGIFSTKDTSLRFRQRSCVCLTIIGARSKGSSGLGPVLQSYMQTPRPSPQKWPKSKNMRIGHKYVYIFFPQNVLKYMLPRFSSKCEQKKLSIKIL